MTAFARLARRFRLGSPIVVVSGLPRSGTSMMMQMLRAGGLPLMTDGIRGPDELNPEGYFELEAVKDLDTGFDLSWLDAARGKAVKVVSSLLVYLPERYNYRVILMQRPLREVIASQNALLARVGEPTDAAPAASLVAQYHTHLRKVQALLTVRPCFEPLIVDYHDALAEPLIQAERVRRFVGRRLATRRMAGVVNEQLYRHRIVESDHEPVPPSELLSHTHEPVAHSP